VRAEGPIRDPQASPLAPAGASAGVDPRVIVTRFVMPLTRRAFLGAAAVSTASTVAALSATSARSDEALDACEPPLAPTGGLPAAAADWGWVRQQFDLDPAWMHFSSFFLASHPRPVRDAIASMRAAIDANPFDVVEHGMFARPQAVREAAAAYVGGRAAEIALTRSTTEGLAIVYSGLQLGPGDEVLTTTHDHYAHHEAIRLAATGAGATVRKVALYDDSRLAASPEMVERVRRAVGPATRAVGVTWVHSSTGVKVPVRAIASLLHELNRTRAEDARVLLVVDGVHGFGVEDDDVAGLGCDFFCAGTHKWILGPRGTGIVWGREASWRRLRPVIPSFEEGPFAAWQEDREPGPTQAAWMSPGGFQAYEHAWALPAAFELHARIGRARIAGRLRELNTRLKEGLARQRGVTVRTPHDPDVSAALVCFEVEGLGPQDVVRKLRERRILASAAPYPVSYARLAAGLVNTTEEVAAAVDAVGELARV
jgi:isopenicillin-N epimerase